LSAQHQQLQQLQEVHHIVDVLNLIAACLQIVAGIISLFTMLRRGIEGSHLAWAIVYYVLCGASLLFVPIYFISNKMQPSRAEYMVSGSVLG
jgi:hypothetical protein